MEQKYQHFFSFKQKYGRYLRLCGLHGLLDDAAALQECSAFSLQYTEIYFSQINTKRDMRDTNEVENMKK